MTPMTTIATIGRSARWCVLAAACVAAFTARPGLAVSGPQAPAATPKTFLGASASQRFVPSVRDLDVRTLSPAPGWQPGMAIKAIPRRNNHQGLTAAVTAAGRAPGPDPLLAVQSGAAAGGADADFGRPRVLRAGQGFSGAIPSDVVGDVGRDYYIQMINAYESSLVAIYHKADGLSALAPFLLQGLAPPGGPCAAGGGDPIVLYDALAGRWFLSEFSGIANVLCVYVSRGEDPITSGWYAYAFESVLSFPDYPKYAVWPDAYYLSTNEDSPGAYAFERTAMLEGRPASFQFFAEAPPLPGFGFQALLPSDHDGPLPPPAGSPNWFIRHIDDEVHVPAGANDPTQDWLETWAFHADFNDPAKSSFTGPWRIGIGEFDSELCGLFSAMCFPQPGGSLLDPLREVVMWGLKYRNRGAFESLVGNFVTDVDGNDHGGIRWFELRRSGGDWALFDEGTFAPDADHRWMGSIAMDGSGNLALGYSVSSTGTYPAVRYTGRLAGDPQGVMSQPEASLAVGSGSMTYNRWGDYSAMSVDPVDDCTFWYTNMYAIANSTWMTRIGAFSFAGCAGPGFSLGAADLDQRVCAAPLADAEVAVAVEVGAYGAFTAPVTLSLVDLPAGFTGGFTVNPVAPPGGSTVQLQVDQDLVGGRYGFGIRGDASGVPSTRLDAFVNLGRLPAAPVLRVPADGATGVGSRPSLSWQAVPMAQTYTLEVATDPAFEQVVYSLGPPYNSGTTDQPTPLAAETEHYWRVRATDFCGDGPYSPTFRFTTGRYACSYPGQFFIGAFNDALTPSPGSRLTNLRVSVDLYHGWVGNLKLVLTHQETGRRVPLLDRPGLPKLDPEWGCAGESVQAVFDDAAGAAAEDACASSPPAIAGNLRPAVPLSGFVGDDLAGTWNLRVEDATPEPWAGLLREWCLWPTDGLVGPRPCDTDGNDRIDRLDIAAIVKALRQRATGPTDPRDPDHDGLVSVLDSRACTLRCNKPLCAP